MIEARPYFRPGQAKDVIGVSRATIYRWAEKGLITLVKRGNMTFVKTAEAIKVIEGDGGLEGGPEVEIVASH